ncbi:hypothetical protein [Hymenobacter siberiensis]|uniref:hypothetical protein n=1 Tax=Hymenobacter siberiensis TaxID=2848396 RepID=UPI001C1E5A57|nr:hypothetical protein [Hymenobacter siberiensis]
MNIDERFKQLENVMVEMLRKQDRTVEELARMREGQSELNTNRTYALQKLCNLKINDLHSRRIFVILLFFSWLVFQLRKS